MILLALTIFSALAQLLAGQALPHTEPLYHTAVMCHFNLFGEFSHSDAVNACRTRRSLLGFFHLGSEERAVRQATDWKQVPGVLNGRYYGGEWGNQLWISLVKNDKGEWVWDNPVYPDKLPKFTPPWSQNASYDSTKRCAIIREFDWIPADCNQRQLAGAHCVTYSRTTPDDDKLLTNNYCGVPELPMNPSNLALPMVMRKTYFFVKGEFTFDEASQACKDNGADTLITGRIMIDVDYQLKNLNFSEVGNRAWIGLLREGSDYKWVDQGPNPNFEPFFDGELDNPDNGECVIYEAENPDEVKVGTEASKIGWRLASCDEMKTNAACETFVFV